MSDFTGSKSSVLLPSARIAIFTNNDELKNVALSLRNDWRFARVSIEVFEGNVDNAVTKYQSETSADLVMVETDTIEDSFVSKLEKLGEHCAETTAAVVVGPVNDVYLYRKLIEMGVSDYLVNPISQEVMADLFSKILIERMGSENSRLIACIGAKGGVGTSSIAQLILDNAGNLLDQKSILLDTAGGWSYTSVALGKEPVTTLHEAARLATSNDKDSFQRMILSVTEKISYLGTGAESLLDDTVSAEQFENIVNRLMKTYPVVVVDLSRAPMDICRSICVKANDVLAVSTPTLSALRSARGLLSELQTMRGGEERGLHLVINKQGAVDGFEVSEKDTVEAVKFKPLLSLDFLPKIFCAAENQGKFISTLPDTEQIISKSKKTVSQLLIVNSRENDVPATSAPGFLDGLLTKIKKKN